MVTEDTALVACSQIVVTLDAARRCAGTLEIAAAFARSTGARLEVLLVEDANLLRLVELPFAQEVDRISGATRVIDGAVMRRALESEARQLRTELGHIRRATSVRTSVRVVRGQILGEAMAASARGGITFVHKAARTLPGLDRLGIAAAPFTRRRRPRAPVLTLFKGGPESARTLSVAAELAHCIDSALTVLVPSRGDEGAEPYKREALEIVAGPAIKFVEGAEGRTLMLRRLLARGAGSLLVLAKASPELGDQTIVAYLEEIGIPLVLVA